MRTCTLSLRGELLQLKRALAPGDDSAFKSLKVVLKQAEKVMKEENERLHCKFVSNCLCVMCHVQCETGSSTTLLLVIAMCKLFVST
jgi:hypothetical protein